MTPRTQRTLFAALVIFGLLVAAAGVFLITRPTADKSADSRIGTTKVHLAAQMGSTASKGGVRVTVLAVSDPAQDLGIATPAGDRWVSTHVRTCVASGHPGLQTGWYQFSVADAAGDRFPGIAWDGAGPAGLSRLPSIYPQFTMVEPGSCVSGWLLVPVPVPVKLTQLIHVGRDGVETGVWSLAG